MSLDNDVWEYDEQHPEGFNTLQGDDLKPPECDLPPQVERRLTNTAHKYERPELNVSRTGNELGEPDEQVFQRRRSSVGAPKRRSSRKATGSYGDENDLKPLSGMTSQEKSDALQSNALFFSEGIPNTTSGKN